MRVLITGGAGFIGAWTGKALRERGDEVIAVDDFSETIYGASLKEARAKELLKGAEIVRMNILDAVQFSALVQETRPDFIVHLAAIAGIRYAQKDPHAVMRVNVEGTVAAFEAARAAGVKRVVYASSSSVYGTNTKTPFQEDDPVLLPVSHYAASKRACELLAEVYRATAGIASTGIRFFTAYGPWGRPDMAYFSFTRALFEGKTIALYAEGKAGRDFTSVHDIVRGVCAVIDNPVRECSMLNLGNSHPVTNGTLLSVLETITEKKARVEMKPLPPEDVPLTYADIIRAKELFGWEPEIKLEDGLKEFVEWYRQYHEL
ncbi:hypothetical protein A3J43_00075 [Candidatus Uhrbacteria bacterium RIFCSPHIGHO2_12_FULL_54_23]|uniref:NAD-dependent epimerase/dehydratase domain-containing protein n=2 Tax=Candidatus Uhriibacteriota TaxID=1752732 RepID=A0A1F7UHJ8_9BACT|nr:MAG: hypothetical protein A3J43_00075 [Candidatus Uhrbacteria bacterium RIFCSPHIGHO2_12_FULL_54_23]OGL90090.1 MAG: hypothetical protein A3J36_01420 [Candidatus Uhrbacteria bacterium RIFCSPLOWO2_02_FULL_54_37]